MHLMSISFLQQSLVIPADGYSLEIVLLAGVIAGGSWRSLPPAPESILTASSMVFPQVRERAGCEQFHFFPAFLLQPLSTAAKGTV